MSIDRTAPAASSAFTRTFGQQAAAAANVQGTTNAERPKAQWWLNVGYEVDYRLEDGSTEKRLVSLPVGIPLDTQEPLKVNSKNNQYAEFVSARNNLLEQLMDAAKSMKPGETMMVPLSIQLRCVDDATTEVAPEKNSFARSIFASA